MVKLRQEIFKKTNVLRLSKKIAAITGSRADFGLLLSTLRGIQANNRLKLDLIVTGSHLSDKHGHTIDEILDSGLPIAKKIPLDLRSDSRLAISEATAIGISKFSTYYGNSQPDLVLLLGDRYEIFSASAAALMMGIPIAHIHGGETTLGAIDEAIRHSITKMSWLHFVSTLEYKKRVVQLGEDPERVHLVGALGVDAIKKTALYDKLETENALGVRFKEKNLLVTIHPETLSINSANAQIESLLGALDLLDDTLLIFTLPNADAEESVIKNAIQEFVQKKENAIAKESLGQRLYLSCLQFVDSVVGNSSSGIIEAPSFKIGTVNIGKRQEGRVKSESVIDCDFDTDHIYKAIHKSTSDEFKKMLSQCNNPYDYGDSAQKIVSILEAFQPPKHLMKKFKDQ